MIILNGQSFSWRWLWGVCILVELLLGNFINEITFIPQLDLLGLLFLLCGVVLVPVPLLIFPKKGNIKPGESFTNTRKVVNTGIYKVLRHPQYFGWGLVLVGLMLLNQHPLTFLVMIIGLILLHLTTLEEEKLLILRFGNEYQEYMEEVPRWNFVAGLILYWKQKINKG